MRAREHSGQKENYLGALADYDLFDLGHNSLHLSVICLNVKGGSGDFGVHLGYFFRVHFSDPFSVLKIKQRLKEPFFRFLNEK